MNFMLIFFLSFIITEISTPFIIDVLKKAGIIDKPETRKIHKESIPRMGGIIIYSIVIILFQAFYQDINSVKMFFTGSVIIFICGLVDDLYDLNWRVKFIMQSMGALLLIMRFAPVFNGMLLFGIDIPEPFNDVVLFLFIVGTINSINLLDGLDGLASGFSILAIFFIGFLAYYKGYFILIIFTTALLGSLLAFLKYNSFPAKIFLGDSGSLVLGYFLVFLSIEIQRPFGITKLDLTFPILLLGVPIIDTLKVMFLRIREGRIPFTADKKHLHHVIFSNKVRHKTTVFVIHGLSILFMINALFYLRYHNIFSTLLFFTMGVILLSARYFTTLTNNLIETVKNLLGQIIELPVFAKKFFSKVFLIGSIFIFVFFTLIQTRYFTIDSNKMFLGLLLGVTVLFLLSIWQFYKNSNLTTVYVFFNFLFFLSLNFLSGDNGTLIIAEKMQLNGFLFHVPFLILTGIVVVFLIGRYSLLPKEYVFLNGMDLSIISFSIMFFLLQPFAQWNISVMNFNLVGSLVLYIWYKMIHFYYRRTSIVVYFGLFVLNITIILTSILYK